jgi:hypothetical protein
MEGNTAYSIHWAQGLVPVGWDENGLVWTYLSNIDERKKMLNLLTGGE